MSSSLVSTTFTKQNSFESKFISQPLTSVIQQCHRALSLISSSTNSSYRDQILSKVLKDITLQITPADENLKSALKKFTITDLIAEEMARLDDTQVAEFLFHRYRYDVHPSDRVLDLYPPCVQIEPSSICNYRCKFCFQTNPSFSGNDSSHMGYMSLSDFKRSVDLITDKVHIVSLASRGEPTLAKNFNEMLEYASSRFLSLKINTNASLLTEKLCHSLLSGNSKTIVLSIDAGNKESYEKLRVNGHFERVLKNLKLLHSIRERHYSSTSNILRASGVFLGEGQSMAEMKATWGSYVDQITFVRYNSWEDPYTVSEPVTNEPCSDLWRRLFIWHDLRINPCDTDYMSRLSLGLLDDFSSLSDVWSSHLYSRLRDMHLNSERISLSPCNGCSLV